MDQDLLAILGRRIRQRRIACGLSQEKLSFEAELDRTHLANIELGKNNPSFLKLCHLCKALSCDLEDLTAGLIKLSQRNDSAKEDG